VLVQVSDPETASELPRNVLRSVGCVLSGGHDWQTTPAGDETVCLDCYLTQLGKTHAFAVHK